MDQNVRTIAMLCHLLSLSFLVGIPFGNILGPLIIWLVKKDEHPFIDQQGKESLNFQILISIITVIATAAITIISMLTCGIGIVLYLPLLVFFIIVIVYVIQAAIAANYGQPYAYPFNYRFIS